MLSMKLISTSVRGLPRWQTMRKQFTELAQEGGFRIRERKEIFLIFALSKLYQIMTMRKNASTLR
jgi:hypothetical protein